MKNLKTYDNFLDKFKKMNSDERLDSSKYDLNDIVKVKKTKKIGKIISRVLYGKTDIRYHIDFDESKNLYKEKELKKLTKKELELYNATKIYNL
jgi:hypothetical protein